MLHHEEHDEEEEDFSDRDPRDESLWPKPTEEKPDLDTLRHWMGDSVGEATDGCQIENDALCEHGHPAWMLVFESDETAWYEDDE